jgi:hypothetical protein
MMMILLPWLAKGRFNLLKIRLGEEKFALMIKTHQNDKNNPTGLIIKKVQPYDI